MDRVGSMSRLRGGEYVYYVSPICQVHLELGFFEVRCFKDSLDCLEPVIHKVQAGFTLSDQRTLSNVAATHKGVHSNAAAHMPETAS